MFTESVVTIWDFRMESSFGEKQRSTVASQFFTGTEDAAMDMTTNEKVSPLFLKDNHPETFKL